MYIRKIPLLPLNKTETGAGERWRRRADFLRDKEAAKNVLDIGEAEVAAAVLWQLLVVVCSKLDCVDSSEVIK